MALDRPVVLLVNPAAGGGRGARARPHVEAALLAHGLTVTTRETASLPHAAELAREAVAAGAVPVSLSGDGVAGAVAGALAEPGAPADACMGVLPGGRGNDFARNAGIPTEPVAACAVIAGATPRRVDVGDVDGRVFLGIASVGFDSEANRHANAAPAGLGALVYGYGALKALARWRAMRFEVRPGRDAPARVVRGYTVACANAPGYGGGMLLAPDADLHDGLLDVVTIADCSKLHLLRMLPTVFSGAHVRDPIVAIERAGSVHVAADRPGVVYADGDPIGTLPATISVRPGAVAMLLPG